jgi:hypothetical protein
VIGGLLAPFGVMITGFINASLQREKLAHDDRVRHEEEDRERQAIRRIVFALLSDLKAPTSIAKQTAEFDSGRWRVTADRLLHRADQLETAAALADNNLILVVLEAAFDVERRLQTIERRAIYGRRLPSLGGNRTLRRTRHPARKHSHQIARQILANSFDLPARCI